MVVLEDGGGIRSKGGYQNKTSANKGEGVQISVILWERNNWMTPLV